MIQSLLSFNTFPTCLNDYLVQSPQPFSEKRLRTDKCIKKFVCPSTYNVHSKDSLILRNSSIRRKFKSRSMKDKYLNQESPIVNINFDIQSIRPSVRKISFRSVTEGWCLGISYLILSHLSTFLYASSRITAAINFLCSVKLIYF